MCLGGPAQDLHEQRQREDPEHDRGSCACCCIDCDVEDDVPPFDVEAGLERLLAWMNEEVERDGQEEEGQDAR